MPLDDFFYKKKKYKGLSKRSHLRTVSHTPPLVSYYEAAMVAAASSAKRRSVSAGTPGVPGGYLSSVSPPPPPPPTHVGASSPPLSEGEVEGQSGGSTGYQFHEVERPYQYQTHLQHQPPPPCPTPHASRFLNYLANIVHNSICLVTFSYLFTNDLILPRRAEFRVQFASYVRNIC